MDPDQCRAKQLSDLSNYAPGLPPQPRDGAYVRREMKQSDRTNGLNNTGPANPRHNDWDTPKHDRHPVGHAHPNQYALTFYL
jgi:hypothetical protein